MWSVHFGAYGQVHSASIYSKVIIEILSNERQFGPPSPAQRVRKQINGIGGDRSLFAAQLGLYVNDVRV